MGFDVPGIIKLLTQERPGAKLTMPIRRLPTNHQTRGKLVRVIGRVAHDDPAGQRVCPGRVDLQRPRRRGIHDPVVVHTRSVARTMNEFLFRTIRQRYDTHRPMPISIFHDIKTAPTDGTVIEVRHGPDQEIAHASSGRGRGRLGSGKTTRCVGRCTG